MDSQKDDYMNFNGPTLFGKYSQIFMNVKFALALEGCVP